MATQVSLYHRSTNVLSESYGTVSTCWTRTGTLDADYWAAWYHHDIYRRNGSTDYEIALNLTVTDSGHEGNANETSSWTPSSTVVFGSGDYLKDVAYIKIDVGSSWNEEHHAYTDDTDNRGTLQTTSVPLAIGVYQHYDEYDYAYDGSHIHDGGYGYIKPTFESSGGTNSTISSDKSSNTSVGNGTTLSSSMTCAISCDTKVAVSSGNDVTVSPSNTVSIVADTVAVSSSGNGTTLQRIWTSSIYSNAPPDSQPQNAATVTGYTPAALAPPYNVEVEFEGGSYHVQIRWNHDTCDTFEVQRRVNGGTWEVI